MATNSSANAKSAGTGLANPYAYLLATQPSAEGATAGDASAKTQAEEKKSTVSTFHNPHLIKRPQSKTTKLPKKPTARPVMPSSSSDSPASVSVQPKPKLADFISTAEEDAAIDAHRREENKKRNMQKKELKKARKKHGEWHPEDPYKVRYPTKIRKFKFSEDANTYRTVKANFIDWLLVAQGQPPRTVATSSSNASPDPSDSRSASPVAPNLLFAPPSFEDNTESLSGPVIELPQTVEEMLARRAQLAEKRGVAVVSPSRSPPLSPLENEIDPEDVPDIASEEGIAAPASRSPSMSPEVFEPEEADPQKIAIQKRLDEIKAKVTAAALKVKLGSKAAKIVSPPPSTNTTTTPPPPPPAPSSVPPPPPPPQLPYNPTISAEPVHYARPTPVEQAPYNPTISAAPVHYARSSPPGDQPPAAVEEPEKERLTKKRKGGAPTEEPPKQSKAAKMMAKMGWKKGEGLGKDSDGITSALTVKAGKNMGSDKVIASVTGGARNQTADHGRFGEPSKVVVSWGCVDGVDFDADAEREDGGIRQEMGDAFNKKFGEVERIFIGMSSHPTPVYIKFNNEMSALNAVNRFFEGYEFRGRSIRAEFYDEKKFNASIYEH